MSIETEEQAKAIERGAQQAVAAYLEKRSFAPHGEKPMDRIAAAAERAITAFLHENRKEIVAAIAKAIAEKA
jgi:hypothetical protein